MFENDGITHGQFENPVFTWEFGYYPVDAIAIAGLTTILAYQITALTFNCFLGIKKPGRANASDLQILLLTAESSVLAVASAVFRSDALDRITYKGAIPRGATIYRRSNPIRKRNILKLFILLLSAPLYNLISIFLVLEGDTVVSFRDARVGGMSVSITPNLTQSLFRTPLTVACQSISVFADSNEKQILAAFSKCMNARFPFDNADTQIFVGDNEKLMLRLQVLQSGEISLDMSKVSTIDGSIILTQGVDVFVDLGVDKEAYRVRPNITSAAGKRLIREGQTWSNDHCADGRKVNEKPAPIVDVSEGDTLNLTADVDCLKMNYSNVNVIVPTMAETIGLEPANDFVVALQIRQKTGITTLEPYEDGSGLPFLRNRRRTTSLATLFFLVVGATVLRIISAFITNNDVDEGIESVLNKRLGIHPCQSMLQSNTVVTFNHRNQTGAQGNFGLERRDLVEVEAFSQSAVIGFERSRGMVAMPGPPGRSAVDDGMENMS